MKRGIIIILLIVVLVKSTHAQDTPTSRASAAVDKLMGWYDHWTGRWTGVGWWFSGNALTALVEYSSRTHNSSFIDLYSHVFDLNVIFFLEGYDDEGWWALAWIDAYSATNEKKYLDLAEAIFKNMAEAWDDTCGGGIWWDRKRTYKNSITNELFLSIASELYFYTKDQTRYLTWALQEWNWFSGIGLINSQNLINDGLSDCKNNGQTTWTYNQGVILGGLVTLSQFTNNSAELIATAEKIANATMELLVSPQKTLQEPCEPSNSCDQDQSLFKGIFMRNLAYLYEATQNQAYADFISLNANSIWNNDRNETSFGLKWEGPYDSADAARQTSALYALNAVLVLPQN